MQMLGIGAAAVIGTPELLHLLQPAVSVGKAELPALLHLQQHAEAFRGTAGLKGIVLLEEPPSMSDVKC